MKDINPWGVANFDPSGLIGRIYVGDRKTFLYAEYKLLASCFQRRFFKGFFPIIRQRELLISGYGQFEPNGLDWQDLCRGPIDIATTNKSYKLWAIWFKKIFFKKFNLLQVYGAS